MNKVDTLHLGNISPLIYNNLKTEIISSSDVNRITKEDRSFLEKKLYQNYTHAAIMMVKQSKSGNYKNIAEKTVLIKHLKILGIGQIEDRATDAKKKKIEKKPKNNER